MGKNLSRKRSRGGQLRQQEQPQEQQPQEQQPQEQEQQQDNPVVSVDEDGVVLTPLISAIRDSRDDSRELNFPKPGAIARITELLNQGADINGTDSIGRTPLMHAVIVGVPEVFFVHLVII